MRQNKKGYTLIELIVVFAMIGIFMASLTTVAVSYMRTFLRVTATGNTQIAGDTVMETIAGELSSAADRRVMDDDNNRMDVNLVVEEDSVRYVNQNGQTIVMNAKDGILHLNYKKIDDDVTGVGSSEADWYIDEKAYQGARIKKLTFEKLDRTDHKILIKVTLVMENEKVAPDYEMEMTKIVELYNLREKGNYSGGIEGDGGSGGGGSGGSGEGTEPEETETETEIENESTEPEEIQEWRRNGVVYEKGDLVKRNGHIYRAKLRINAKEGDYNPDPANQWDGPSSWEFVR